MNKERKPFITLGNSRFSRIANITVLVLLIGYIVSKTGLISLSLFTEFVHTIPANELQVKTQQELVTRLNGYTPNPEVLKNELQKVGLSFEEFKKNVAMEVTIDSDSRGLKGLIISFESNLPEDRMKPVYSYLVNEITQYVKQNRATP